MILPSITTITKDAWRKKIEEIKQLGLKEVSAFLTCLDKAERSELYKLVKDAGVEKLPFVHLRSDMEASELDYLIDGFGTEVFNLHTSREFPVTFDRSKYKDMIYIENTYDPLDEEEISSFAGVCLDFQHLDSDKKLRKDIYEHNIKVLEKFKIGCNHISPQKDIDLSNGEDTQAGLHHSHYLNDLSQLDYIKDYPERYFSDHIAVEMENSIAEQLKAIEYIKGIVPYVR